VGELTDITNEYNDSVREFGAEAPPFSQSIGQRAALCNEAYDIIIRSGGSPEQEMATAEFSVLAGSQEKAREIAQRVVDAKPNPGAIVRGLRVIGTLQFQSMDLDSGRATYARAAHIYDSHPYNAAPPLEKAGYNSYTEIDWANLEWGAHQCSEARDHLARSIAILQGVGNPIGQTKDQIDASASGINACT
jgi:hypothetical protein